MFEQAIRDFPKQFEFTAHCENADNLQAADKFLIVGMGGSHLAADLLRTWKPELDIIINMDYGLPAQHTACRVILVSYSGNTEEVISALDECEKHEIIPAIISVGGILLDRARAANFPYVQLPNTGIQPRSAVGFMFKALLLLIGEREAISELEKLAVTLKPEKFEEAGRKIANELRSFVPIIYSSSRNGAIAQNWKIKFNETGKIPAFWNVIPELNHNEMNGFDVTDRTESLSRAFKFIFLEDQGDDPRVQKRFNVLSDLYRKRGLQIESIKLSGETQFEKIFLSLILADWVSFYAAEYYGNDPEQVPMVEAFKKAIAS